MIQIEHDLWDVEAIAKYLKMAESYVGNRIVCLPDFPQAIRLPTGKRSHPRWKAIEVIRWVEQFQEKRAA
jgi:predicted DNA-binding transcriptional regulator AlpA